METQPVTASWVCCIPRLIAAPQQFFQSIRPTTLPANMDVTVVGIYSRNAKKHLSYFPNIMHDLGNYEKYSVTTISVKSKDRKTIDSTAERYLLDKREICTQLIGPVGISAGIGILLLVGLLGLAIACKDRIAVVALVLLSLTSTLAGLGSKWKFLVRTWRAVREAPRGDVLIKDTKGAFLIVQCGENISRRLYFSEDKCEYLLRETPFRICSGLGKFSLMAAVVILTDCTWNLKLAIVLAYAFLNAVYWAVEVLPDKYRWRLDMFEIEVLEETKMESYTECLWEVGQRTKTMSWAYPGNMVPDTAVWREWIIEAEIECKRNSGWDYSGRLAELLMRQWDKVPKRQQPRVTVPK